MPPIKELKIGDEIMFSKYADGSMRIAEEYEVDFGKKTTFIKLEKEEMDELIKFNQE